MKTYLKLVLVSLAFAIVGHVKSQSFDPLTIGIFKPKKSRLEYRFNNTTLSKVRIKTIGPQKRTYKGGEMARDLVNDVLVDAFNFTTSSSQEMDWELHGKLLCNNDSLNWEVMLFAEGLFEKEKERVEENDGSTSVKTTKYKYVHWEEGTTGVIIENESLVAEFGIYFSPRNDSLIYNSYREAFLDQPEPIKTQSKNKYYIESIDEYIEEYAVLGRFRGNQFTLIANGDSRRMWFYVNNELQWIFKTDVDNLLPIRKKDRFMPSLQVAGDIPSEKLFDCYRMALVSKYLSTALSKDEY